VLEGDRDSAAVVGPSRQTREQIERHKRLKRHQKHAFFSVSAVFDVPGR
jgi:hypothetical protein